MEEMMVTIPLDFLEELRRWLDKARNPDNAPFIAGVACGMLALFIKDMKKQHEELEGSATA